MIHTTANHPWLTAERGWVVAGKLRVGEPVRLLDGATATVVALHTLPGVGPMWDLSLADVHTFAVGDARAIAHNCDSTDDLVSPQRRTRILGGDGTGGGHRAGTGISGKTAFPAEWSDDEITDNVADVATDPNSTIRSGGNGRMIAEGTRTVAQTGQRVDIRVILTVNGEIISGYPTNLPRNP